MGAPLDHHHLPSCHLGHQEVVQYFSLPKSIRSGGTPQFRGEAFKAYCKDNGILHETSSPYNPESNGLAEAAVKNVKKLLIKCIKEGTDVQAAPGPTAAPPPTSCSVEGPEASSSRFPQPGIFLLQMHMQWWRRDKHRTQKLQQGQESLPSSPRVSKSGCRTRRRESGTVKQK